ncbi:MAG: hypothetical protein ACKOAO_09280 [Oxalobacteraceae bacterium]
MNRDARKKMLIVEGMMHRLELAEATRQLRQDIRPSAVVSRLPALLTVLAQSKALPLMGTAFTLLSGRGMVSRLLRRVVVIGGFASVLAVVVKRWKARVDTDSSSPQ